MFLFQHDLKDVAHFKPFQVEPEQMVFDFRTSAQKKSAAQGLHLTTFKTECDIYKQRPLLVVCKQTQSVGWFPSVHRLITQKVTIHVCADTEDEDMISFSFYAEGETYSHVQTIKVPRKHYECTMEINDRRLNDDKNSN